jgi:hypothetical protein
MFLRRLAALGAASLMACGVVTAAVVESAPSVGAAGGPIAYTILLIPGSTCRLATVDLSTGALVALPTAASSASCVGDLTQTSDGRVYGVATLGEEDVQTVHLIQFDTATGAPTDLGQVGAFEASIGPTGAPIFGGITFDSAGRLFVSMVGDDAGCSDGQGSGNAFCLYEVDPASPASATFKGLGTVETTEQALAAACGGPMMTLADDDSPAGSLQFGAAAGSEGADSTTSSSGGDGPTATGDVTAQVIGLGTDAILNLRDPSNGAMTPIGTGVGADIELTGIEFDTAGTLWGIGVQYGLAAVSKIFTVDPTTGLATAGPTLVGEENPLPIGLALPLTCPAALEVTPTFTG